MDTLFGVAAKHRVEDIIAMGFQTVDECINLYSPEQDNRNLRLVYVNIIEGRGGEDHRVGRLSTLGSEFIRVSLVE